MKKHVLILLLAVMVLTLLVAGCATSKRAELIENRLGATELKQGFAEKKIEEDRIKLAELKGYTRGLGDRLDVVEKTEATLKADISNIANNLKKVEADTKGQIQDLGRKTEDLNKGLGIVRAEIKTEIKQVQKEYSDIRSYALTLRKIIAEREAKHSYKAGSEEKIVVCFVGFKQGQSKLDSDLEAGLEKALAKFKEKNCEVEEIHGFASTLGFLRKNPEESEKLNQQLSLDRAKTTQSWFKEKGLAIPDDKVFGLGGVVKFGTERDNRTVAIFGMPKPPTTPAPAPAPVPSPPTKP